MAVLAFGPYISFVLFILFFNITFYCMRIIYICLFIFPNNCFMIYPFHTQNIISLVLPYKYISLFSPHLLLFVLCEFSTFLTFFNSHVQTLKITMMEGVINI
jgi:hypothetical protein